MKVGVEFVQVLKAYDVGYAYCLAASEILGLNSNPNPNLDTSLLIRSNPLSPHLGLTNQVPNQEKSLWEVNHQLCWDLFYSLLQCEKSRGDTKAAGKLIQALGRKTKTIPQTVIQIPT